MKYLKKTSKHRLSNTGLEMLENWRECKLGDVAEIMGGGTPKTSTPEYWNGDIPWLTPRDLTGYEKVYISRGERLITKEGLKSSSTKIMPKGTVLLTSRAPIGYVAIAENEICTNQGFKSLVPNFEILNSEFLYYWLKTNTDYLQQLGTGTTFAEISGSVVKDISISLPPLQEQKAIAEILSSLDDKIDLLHRQNHTLESLAQTLFRQWFIQDANPEWEEVKLGDLVESANTGLDAIKRAPITEEETGIKCLRIQDISQNKSFDNWGNTCVNEKDFQKAQLKKNDIIIARTCSPGLVYFVEDNLQAVFNNGLAKIRPNTQKTYAIFLYYLFKTEDFIGYIYGISGGTSVQLNMRLGDLLNYKVKFPSKDLQDIYLESFISFDNKINHNKKQIQTLEKLRDTLLPKLISGEVRIKI